MISSCDDAMFAKQSGIWTRPDRREEARILLFPGSQRNGSTILTIAHANSLFIHCYIRSCFWMIPLGIISWRHSKTGHFFSTSSSSVWQATTSADMRHNSCIYPRVDVRSTISALTTLPLYSTTYRQTRRNSSMQDLWKCHLSLLK